MPIDAGSVAGVFPTSRSMFVSITGDSFEGMGGESAVGSTEMGALRRGGRVVELGWVRWADSKATKQDNVMENLKDDRCSYRAYHSWWWVSSV